MGRLVSLIIPVFNGEKYIRDAVQSVVDQTHSAWELLIIDDGSTDETWQVINSFKDTRIRCFRTDRNGGVSMARNKGLQEMTGDFFCFLDSDDLLPSGSLAERLLVFELHSDCFFVDGVVDVFDATLNTKLRSWKPSFEGEPFKELCLLTGRCFFGPSWLVRRERGRVYRFDESMRFAEDLWFYIQLASTGGNYRATPATILKYRKHGQSAMNNLAGLADGYTQLAGRIITHFQNRLSILERLYFVVRVRKIMFLSFVSVKMWKQALWFLLMGRRA